MPILVGRSPEFPESNWSSSMLLKLPPIPELSTWLAIDLMLPVIPCIAWHYDKWAWVQVDGNVCTFALPRLLRITGSTFSTEAHHACRLKRDYNNPVVEAHEINMGTDTLDWNISLLQQMTGQKMYTLIKKKRKLYLAALLV